MAQSVYYGVDDWALAALHLANAGRMDTGPLRQLVLRYASPDPHESQIQSIHRVLLMEFHQLCYYVTG
jgi:hypothetical protein